MLLNTRFYVDKALDRRAFVDMVSAWLNSSSNYQFVSPISCDFETDEYQFESEDKSQRLTFNNYDERFVAQLVVDSNGATYTTNFVLDDVSEQPSLHLSQNKVFTTMSTDSDKRQAVNLPNIVKSIFWNEYGGDDNGIMTDNRPLLLRKSSVQLAADILTHRTSYLNPIVYVSPNNQSGLPDLDCEKVAQELMGQAHVVVESSPLVGNSVKELLDEDTVQPHNGAVRVIFPSGDSKLFVKDKNNFDYSVINSVRRIMANVDIEADFNINKIRQRHIMDKLANSEDKDLVQLCEQMISDKDNEIADLKKEMSELRQQLYTSTTKAERLQESFDKNDEASEKGVQLAVAGAEIYDGEMLNVILKVLQKEYDSMTGDAHLVGSRKYDVLGDVLEHNFPCTTDTRLIECVEGAFKDGALTREGIGSLKSAGFEVDKGSRSSHYKIYFKNFDKYFTTVSCTPSDKSRGAKNAVSQFCNTLFGY